MYAEGADSKPRQCEMINEFMLSAVLARGP